MISVVVTAYNAEKYINQCLESCINQTFKNIEIIVVDDGSNDKTAQEVKRYCQIDNRVKYIYQENSGVSVARNTGINMAAGKFIMFVDGDDYLDDEIVFKLYAHMNSQIDIIACCCTCFNGFHQSEDHFFNGSCEMSNVEEKEKLYTQLMKIEAGQPQGQEIFTAIGVPWGKLYRMSMLKNYNLKFNSMLRRMQDNVFNMYAFAVARKIVYLDESLYQYRIDHITGYTKAYSPDIYYEVLKEREQFFSSNKSFGTDRLLESLYFEKMDWIICSMKNIVMNSNFKESRIKIKDLCYQSIYRDFLDQKIDTSVPGKLRVVKFFDSIGFYSGLTAVMKVRYARQK
jgi:glycosyltransferase involved in cell wall biosynthesis